MGDGEATFSILIFVSLFLTIVHVSITLGLWEEWREAFFFKGKFKNSNSIFVSLNNG